MVYAGKLMLAIVGGGAMLGSLLGSFASPVMKPGPASPWGNLAGSSLSAEATAAYIEPLPENLTPPTVPDGYAPAIAFTELPELQPPEVSIPSFAEYDDESYATWARWRGDSVPPAPEKARVTGGTRTEFVQVAQAAGAAEAAAEDTAVAAPPVQDPVSEEPELSPLY
jgi:hypothetical protein